MQVLVVAFYSGMQGKLFKSFVFILLSCLFSVNFAYAGEKSQGSFRLSDASSFSTMGALAGLVEKFRLKHPEINIEIEKLGSVQVLAAAPAAFIAICSSEWSLYGIPAIAT